MNLFKNTGVMITTVFMKINHKKYFKNNTLNRAPVKFYRSSYFVDEFLHK